MRLLVSKPILLSLTFIVVLKTAEKKVMVAVCDAIRKMVHIVYGVLKTGKPFDPNYWTKLS